MKSDPVALKAFCKFFTGFPSPTAHKGWCNRLKEGKRYYLTIDHMTNWIITYNARETDPSLYIHLDDASELVKNALRSIGFENQ